MAPAKDDTGQNALSQADFHELLQEKLRLAIRLTFNAFPKPHWTTIRTTYVIERIFLEVKKRSIKKWRRLFAMKIGEGVQTSGGLNQKTP